MAERKKTTTTRKRKKKSAFGDTAKMFSRFEVLFIVVLFLGFFIWAFSKCSSNGIKAPITPNTETTQNEGNTEDTGTDISSAAAANNPNSPTYDLSEATEEPTSTTSVPALTGEVEVVSRDNSSARDGRRSYTPLYVTLQDLKVRKGPSRDSSIITTLNINEEVMFMEKRTDFRERINIGTEVTNEPWVYIQTKKGRKGWVYGAGIHYFKWDRLKDPIPSISNEGSEEDEGE